MQKFSPKILAQALYEATQGQSVSESALTVRSFVHLLAKKRLLGKEEEIIEAYKKRLYDEQGIVEAEVTTAFPLARQAEEKIKTFIKKEFNSEHVEIHHRLEESLLGGIKIKVGDTVLDETLKGRLTQLAKTL